MFHSILRELREERGFSQKEFADMLSLPVTTYRNYENTQREPGYDTLIKIANLLGVSVDELLGVSCKDTMYYKYLAKARRLSKKNLQILSAFTDFLLSSNSANNLH